MQAQLLPQDSHQDVNAHGDPHLGFDCVGAVAEKVFDPQVLLDPFEEQLHLPAALVELGDGQRGKIEVIGQEHQDFAVLRVPVTHAPKAVWVVFDTFIESQPDDMIASQPGAFVHRARLQPVELDALFVSRDIERPGQCESVEALEIHIAAIHHVEGSGLWNEVVQHAHIGHFPLGNRDHRRDGAAQINQRVQFHGGFVGTKTRPGKKAQAQVDCGRIQRVYGLVEFDAHRLLRVKNSGSGDQKLGEIKVDSPVSGTVGVGQRAARDSRAETHPIELVGSGAQTDFDILQAISKSNLGECHGKKLVPAGEAADHAIAVITLDTAAELLRVDGVEDLRENSAHPLILGINPAIKSSKNATRNSNRSHPCSSRFMSHRAGFIDVSCASNRMVVLYHILSTDLELGSFLRDKGVV